MTVQRSGVEERFELSPTSSEGPLVGTMTIPIDAPVTVPWVLYLHGFGSSQQGEKAEFFRSRCAGAGLSFVSFDFQGHGLSGGSTRDLTIGRCLRDVERVRSRIGSRLPGPPVLLGSSMGGLVGLWHATAQPVRAGAFLAPALGLEETFPNLIGEEGMRRWKQSGVLPITNELGTFDLGWEFVEDLRSRRIEDLQERHTIPTIILQGKLDDRVSWEAVQRFSDALDTPTQLVLFADGGHRLMERREIIWKRIFEFWTSLQIFESATMWPASP